MAERLAADRTRSPAVAEVEKPVPLTEAEVMSTVTALGAEFLAAGLLADVDGGLDRAGFEQKIAGIKAVKQHCTMAREMGLEDAMTVHFPKLALADPKAVGLQLLDILYERQAPPSRNAVGVGENVAEPSWADAVAVVAAERAAAPRR